MASLRVPLDHGLRGTSIFTGAVRKPHVFSVVCLSGAGSSSSTVSSYSEVSAEVQLQKTRGELFLEQTLKNRRTPFHERKGSVIEENTDNSSKQISQKQKKEKEKEKEKRPPRSLQPVCYGCGAILQTQEEEAPGFVPMDTYLTKKKHHQLKTVLCGRCRLLSHGQMIPAVGGHGGYAGAKRFVSAEQLRVQLSHLCDEKAVVVKLVDIVDFNGSFITRIRDLVGANPIVLVVTKIDLLPKGTDLNAIGDWILEFTLRKKLNVISVHLTSAKSLLGISSVVSFLRQHRQGRDVYILGSANVGKSAFVSAILHEMARRDPYAVAAMKHMPVQSSMPGTTLGPIEIEAFSGGGSLFDTPGIHVHHRMTAVVAPEDLAFLAPRRRLRGYFVSSSVSQGILNARSTSKRESLTNDMPLDVESCSDIENVGLVEGPVKEAGTVRVNCLAGMSILWGGILRLDIVKAPPSLGVRLFGPSALAICTIATSEADEFYEKELGIKLTPPTNTDNWEGLQARHVLSWTVESWDRPVCDIAFSGVGWITIEPDYSTYLEGAEAGKMEAAKELQVRIHVPKALEIFARPPIPVGVYGSEWYEYRDLTEQELEARPRVFLP